MLLIIFLTLVFSISSMGTTVLLGDRGLLSGKMLDWNGFFHVITNWRFILAMFLALAARYSFMLINGKLLMIPKLASNSTTITAFITSISVIFLIIGNVIFLHERMSYQQALGASLIMIGIWVILK